MKILSIYLNGFKGYNKEGFYLDFRGKDFSKIIAGNGKGKTSIGEGITWCLYGCNLNGQGNTDTELFNKDSDTQEMLVRCEIELEDGNIYKITRIKRKTLVVKVEWFDGKDYKTKKVTQKQLKELLPSKELFLTVFNSAYFLNQNVSNARNQLLNMLPQIDVEEVLNTYNGIEHKDIIEKYDNTSIGIKTLNTDINTLKETLNQKIGSKNTLTELLAKSRSDCNVDSEEIVVDEERLNSLRNELIEIKSSRPQEIDMSALKVKLAEIEGDIKTTSKEVYISDNTDNTKEIELKMSMLKGQKNALTNTLLKVSSLNGVCSECGQPITEEFKVDKLMSIQNDIDGINTEIETLEQTMNVLTELESNNKNQFETEKNTKINELGKQKEDVLIQIDTVLKTNKDLIDNFESTTNDTIKKINDEIFEIEEKKKLKAMDEKNYQQASYSIEKYTKMLRDNEEEITSINKQIQDKEIEKSILTEYNTNYVNYISNIMQNWLNDVKISLFKYSTTTGEIKDDFTISYKGKNYKLISNSEKVKVGLEISNMFNKALGIKLPVFIDNGECILNIPVIDTQMIIAEVSDCEMQLKSFRSEEKESIKIASASDSKPPVIESKLKDNYDGVQGSFFERAM